MQASLDRSTSELAVSTVGLTKRFGDRTAVSGISLEVGRGRAYGLLGPNGAGKTTTVRLLSGLLTPDAGEVSLFGEPVTRANADELRARIGVQTDTNLYETLSARENLRTWGSLYGLRGSALASRIDAVLDLMGLAGRADSLVGEFSKGMRQKLAVGRAILHEPELLFLDEPTAGLDPEASADLIGHLGEMMRDRRTTLIICTHQLHGLEALCDEIGIIRGGSLLVTGSVTDLLRRRWPNQRFEITVDGDPSTAAAALSRVAGAAVEREQDVLTLDLADGACIPEAVAGLVGAGVPVRAVVPVVPTIEQYYFATLEEGARS